MLFLFLFSFSSFIFVYHARKKKNRTTQPLAHVHNTFEKILIFFAPDKEKQTITIAEAKNMVPKECYLTHRFLDQYSDFSYAPDSDIDISELSYSALDSIEEIESREKVNA
jgi:hypothetical protein